MISVFCNYFDSCSLRSQKRELVRFSGKARKTNHIPFFCKRSEQ
ncbi:MAG: hypothetical protein U5L45_02050 [Saprospiraceae bacterium]|nr:hypothetical protein [Saprospiraceae bacterium]